MQDVRDDKSASGGGPLRLGSASPFNIKAASLRLADFQEVELRALYQQHTEDTGQGFTEAALAEAWRLTQGQPWLVNALAQEAVEAEGQAPIDVAQITAARERLIRARATHLDSLLARLREPRVRRVLEPVISGELIDSPSFDDDFQYVVELGLVEPETPVRIANPIYREVILRVLASPVEANLVERAADHLLEDGRLDMRSLFERFLVFWGQHSEALLRGVPYPEAAPHLVLMAWLHRIVNGRGGDDGEAVRRAGEPGVPAVSHRGEPTRSGGDGEGVLEREVGVGRGRVDLLLR